MAWTFAKADQTDALLLFAALAEAAKQGMGEFNAQALANMA